MHASCFTFCLYEIKPLLKFKFSIWDCQVLNVLESDINLRFCSLQILGLKCFRLLTMGETYYEEHMGAVIDNMLSQVPMFGEG